MRLMSNTDKVYPCTMCGSEGNIIREGTNPRLKCNVCNFMYDASDSQAAVEQGTIPDGIPDVVESTAIEEFLSKPVKVFPESIQAPTNTKLPRTLHYVIVSRDRTEYEFSNSRDVKKRVLQWSASSKSFEVFELIPKAVSAKIEIE